MATSVSDSTLGSQWFLTTAPTLVLRVGKSAD